MTQTPLPRLQRLYTHSCPMYCNQEHSLGFKSTAEKQILFLNKRAGVHIGASVEHQPGNLHSQERPVKHMEGPGILRDKCVKLSRVTVINLRPDRRSIANLYNTGCFSDGNNPFWSLEHTCFWTKLFHAA